MEDTSWLVRGMEEGAMSQRMRVASGRGGETGRPTTSRRNVVLLNLDFRSSDPQDRKVIEVLF